MLNYFRNLMLKIISLREESDYHITYSAIIGGCSAIITYGVSLFHIRLTIFSMDGLHSLLFLISSNIKITRFRV